MYAKKDRRERDRIRSAEDELTEFKKAQFEKNFMRQTGYSHALVEEWGYDASTKAKAAQTAARATAEAAIKARTDLVSSYNTEGEATLRTANEAAIRAEAELARKKTYAAKFKSVDRMRTKLKNIGMAEMEAAHDRQTLITDKITVGKLARRISRLASGYARHARAATLTALDKKWSNIVVLANLLEDSVEDTNRTDRRRIIEHLGATRTMIENTSLDNENEANKIIAELSQAQAIGIREIASSRPRPTEAGLRRTKKHKKKRHKTSKAKH